MLPTSYRELAKDPRVGVPLKPSLVEEVAKVVSYFVLKKAVEVGVGFGGCGGRG